MRPFAHDIEDGCAIYGFDASYWKHTTMRHRTILITALLLNCAVLTAQTSGEIRGRVLDPNGDPQPFANVYTTVSGALVGCETDMDGRFILKPLPTGLYSIHYSFSGYATLEMAGVEVTPDRATYVKDQRMKGKELGEYEKIEYRRKLITIDDPNRMSLLAEEFEHDPTRRDPIQFLSKNFAGVTAAPNGDGLYFRGSRSENMVSFIDGIKVSGAVPHVPPSAISNVSVYTGGLPAKYGDVTGGVVVMETKTYAEMYQAANARQAKFEREEPTDPE